MFKWCPRLKLVKSWQIWLCCLEKPMFVGVHSCKVPKNEQFPHLHAQWNSPWEFPWFWLVLRPTKKAVLDPVRNYSEIEPLTSAKQKKTLKRQENPLKIHENPPKNRQTPSQILEFPVCSARFFPPAGLHLVPQGRHKQWRLVRRGGAIEVGTSGNFMGLDHLNGDMNGNFERDFMGFFGFFVGNYGDSWWFQWHGKFDGFNAHLIRF